jgi:transposase
LHEYLLKIRDQVLPKSEAGQAVSYALKNWAALTRYCEDGDLSIGRVEMWRGGLDSAYLFAGLSCSGASLA